MPVTLAKHSCDVAGDIASTNLSPTKCCNREYSLEKQLRATTYLPRLSLQHKFYWSDITTLKLFAED